MKSKQKLASLYISCLLLFSGCALLKPKNFAEFKEGEWQGKVLIRDLKNSKTGIVNIKVKAIDSEKIRIDILSAVGTHVGSILMQSDEFQYLNIAEKTLTKSKPNREALKEAFRIPLDPKVLYNIFFDRPIADKSWSCMKDSKGLLLECKDVQANIEILWHSRQGEKRTIDIKSPGASVQMNLHSFESHISDPNKAFTLKVPATFKIK